MATVTKERWLPRLAKLVVLTRRLEKSLRQWFRRQRSAVLNAFTPWLQGRSGEIPTTAREVLNGPDYGPIAMAGHVFSRLEIIWDLAGFATTEKLNGKLDTIGERPKEWNVRRSDIREQIYQLALAFCEETNATTSLALDDALFLLRDELAKSIVETGESGFYLRKRVESVFDQAETWRAERIARTEAIRAHHAAQLEAAHNSGVVIGWEWLVSSDACPLCHEIANKVGRVRLGENFAVIGDHPIYKHIPFPPAHPHCGCSMIEILMPEITGDGPPVWGEALVKP